MRQMESRTFDARRPSAFLPYMLLRMFSSAARRFRPSSGWSPAMLFAVVFGLVSESCSRVSLGGDAASGCLSLPCSLGYRHCTATEMLARVSTMVAPASLRRYPRSCICAQEVAYPELLEAAHFVVLLLVLHLDI
jgi:hypothetical protein